MARKMSSSTEGMDRAFRLALRLGQARYGEKNSATAQLVTVGTSSYYKKLRSPGEFRVSDARIIARRYFNDRQLCEAFGVEYHGGTPE